MYFQRNQACEGERNKFHWKTVSILSKTANIQSVPRIEATALQGWKGWLHVCLGKHVLEVRVDLLMKVRKLLKPSSFFLKYTLLLSLTMLNTNLEGKYIFLHILILFLNLRGHYFAFLLISTTALSFFINAFVFYSTRNRKGFRVSNFRLYIMDSYICQKNSTYNSERCEPHGQ